MSAPKRDPQCDLYIHVVRWRAGEKLYAVRNLRGRLEALVSPTLLEVGVVEHETRYLPLTPAEAWQVDRALARWERRRELWAAYRVFGSPTVMRVVPQYTPPGVGSRARNIVWTSPEIGTAGALAMRSPASVIPNPAPVEIAPGIVGTAVRWRTVPGVGPEAGEQVGEHWDVGRGLSLELERDIAVLRGKDEMVGLAPADARFLDEVRRMKHALWPLGAD